MFTITCDSKLKWNRHIECSMCWQQKRCSIYRQFAFTQPYSFFNLLRVCFFFFLCRFVQYAACNSIFSSSLAIATLFAYNLKWANKYHCSDQHTIDRCFYTNWIFMFQFGTAQKAHYLCKAK